MVAPRFSDYLSGRGFAPGALTTPGTIAPPGSFLPPAGAPTGPDPRAVEAARQAEAQAAAVMAAQAAQPPTVALPTGSQMVPIPGQNVEAAAAQQVANAQMAATERASAVRAILANASSGGSLPAPPAPSIGDRLGGAARAATDRLGQEVSYALQDTNFVNPIDAARQSGPLGAVAAVGASALEAADVSRKVAARAVFGNLICATVAATGDVPFSPDDPDFGDITPDEVRAACGDEGYQRPAPLIPAVGALGAGAEMTAPMNPYPRFHGGAGAWELMVGRCDRKSGAGSLLCHAALNFMTDPVNALIPEGGGTVKVLQRATDPLGTALAAARAGVRGAARTPPGRAVGDLIANAPATRRVAAGVAKLGEGARNLITAPFAPTEGQRAVDNAVEHARGIDEWAALNEAGNLPPTTPAVTTGVTPFPPPGPATTLGGQARPGTSPIGTWTGIGYPPGAINAAGEVVGRPPPPVLGITAGGRPPIRREGGYYGPGAATGFARPAETINPTREQLAAVRGWVPATSAGPNGPYFDQAVPTGYDARGVANLPPKIASAMGDLAAGRNTITEAIPTNDPAIHWIATQEEINPSYFGRAARTEDSPMAVVDGTDVWIVEGHHRVAAARQAGEPISLTYVDVTDQPTGGMGALAYPAKVRTPEEQAIRLAASQERRFGAEATPFPPIPKPRARPDIDAAFAQVESDIAAGKPLAVRPEDYQPLRPGETEPRAKPLPERSLVGKVDQLVRGTGRAKRDLEAALDTSTGKRNPWGDVTLADQDKAYIKEKIVEGRTKGCWS